jgi:hypothetical protein
MTIVVTLALFRSPILPFSGRKLNIWPFSAYMECPEANTCVAKVVALIMDYMLTNFQDAEMMYEATAAS